MGEEEMKRGRSLADTPTWSVATVTTAMVVVGFIVQRSIHHFGKWLQRTRRKPLLAALEKIKEELMLFGLLSLLLGHWTMWVAKICVKSSKFSTRFYPCSKENRMPIEHMLIADVYYSNYSAFHDQRVHLNHCPEGYEPFVSYKSLEQLHRFLFVLGVIHVSYCCFTVAMAMAKIYSWRTWEAQAKSMAIQNMQGSSEAGKKNVIVRRQSTFIVHHTSHPWSKNKVLIWMLCFIRQFWRSINRADYMALRFGFITNHNLHLSYNFHNYMLRSIEDEFRNIVGISWQLWGYAIICIFLNIHGTNIYFWLSFIPAVAILLIGTKLHHVVAQLALEVMETSPFTSSRLNLRDDLFWFRKPKLLLWLIQFISFQNAFEMATYIWSLVRKSVEEKLCYILFVFYFRSTTLLQDRGTTPKVLQQVLGKTTIQTTFDVVARIVGNKGTFLFHEEPCVPSYSLDIWMGSKFKKALIAEDIRESLHGWCKRVKEKLRQND